MPGLAEFIYTSVLPPGPLKRAANALILSTLPKTVRVGPATIHLNPNDPVLSGALALRVYERQEIAFFRKICRPHITVLDIGANTGLYTALAMHLCPYGRVIAIEPHAESCEFLRRTIAANADSTNAAVEVFECAASDHGGTAQLFLNPDNKADNRLYRSEMTPRAQSAAVRLRAIDDILAEQSIASIDILKIDVQGAELAAITGAAKTIRNSPAITLLTEFWPQGIWQASGRDPSDYIDLLIGLGLELNELRHGRLLPLSLDWRRRLTGRRYTNLVARRLK
jgi:FkbM family methyltransferase